jgi:hypothetical protein
MGLMTIFPVLLLASGMIGRAPSDCMEGPVIFTSVPPHQMVAREEIIIAKLSTPLKAGKAKIGDRVVARVSGDYTQNGAVVIPRGSLIYGRVTQAHKRSKSDQESRLAFTFDQLRLKRGKVVPFAGQIILVEQHFRRSDCQELWYRTPEDSQGNKVETEYPDFYHLNTVIQQPEGEQGVLLSSTQHDIKLGWDIQLGLRFP